MDGYEISIDGGDWIDVGLSTNYTFTNLKEGNHSILLKARDVSGNVAIVKLVFIVDITPPFIEIISPENGSTVGDTFYVLWEAYDSVGYIEKIEVYVGGELIASYLHGINITDRHKIHITMGDGWYVLCIVAYDPAGLQSQDTIKVYVETWGVFITSPTNGSAFNRSWIQTVSYTHLTLPTTERV